MRKILMVFVALFLLATVLPCEAQEGAVKCVPIFRVKVAPEFQGGGLDKFKTWVEQQVADGAKQEKCGTSEGRVMVQFVITEAGDVVEVKVVRSEDEVISNIVNKIVSASPRWKPAQDGEGQIVAVRYILPVDYKL